MSHHKTWQSAFAAWLPFAITIIIFGGLVYAAIQQSYRQSANDPQIQIAEDVSLAITKGAAAPDNIVPPAPTADMAQSLSTFLIIYSATGTPVGGSVMLDGKIPTPPAGVFEKVKQQGQQRFTWQPKAGVREAVVVERYTGPQEGYVLVGRSLRDIEVREKHLTLMTAAAAVAALVLTFLAVWYWVGLNRRYSMAAASSEHHHA